MEKTHTVRRKASENQTQACRDITHTTIIKRRANTLQPITEDTTTISFLGLEHDNE
ncbi:MAG: hypothetical protein VYA34_16630 [Myxococcota bacterium]|nr:hypothetical protein [Myxococcota bacterium]